jgi:hypothetical protein
VVRSAHTSCSSTRDLGSRVVRFVCQGTKSLKAGWWGLSAQLDMVCYLCSNTFRKVQHCIMKEKEFEELENLLFSFIFYFLISEESSCISTCTICYYKYIWNRLSKKEYRRKLTWLHAHISLKKTYATMYDTRKILVSTEVQLKKDSVASTHVQQ